MRKINAFVVHVAVCLMLVGVISEYAAAQTIPEVLYAIQERKLALEQRNSVGTALQRHAEEINTGAAATTPVNDVLDSELIDWLHNVDPFPGSGALNGKSMPEVLSLLNQASRELELLKRQYVNIDTKNPERHYPDEPGLGNLPPIGDFTESNFRKKLILMASQVENLKALSWPMECNMATLNSNAVEEFPTPPTPITQPSYRPNIPFITGSGTITYDKQYSVSVLDEGLLYQWHGSGTTNSATMRGAAGVKGMRGLRVVDKPQGASVSRDGGFLSGSMHVYKRMMYDPYYYAPETAEANPTQLPLTHWRRFDFESGGTLTLGTVDYLSNTSSNSGDLGALEAAIRNVGDIPSFTWNGSWVSNLDSSPGYTFKFNGMPEPEEAGSSSGGAGGGYGAASVEIRARCLFFPNFTSMTGFATRKKLGYAASSPTHVDVPVDKDMTRIDLGRGLHDLNQVAYLGTRLDGFGNPVFMGSMNAFRVMYEVNLSGYPSCLVSAKLKYDRKLDEFTETQIEQTGWPSKDEYVRNWYIPKLRRIYGADLVVDIVHTSDYKKIITFYAASQAAPPAEGDYEIPSLTGTTALKTVVLENPLATSGFPSSNKTLQIDDDGLFWKITKTDANYAVTAGTTAGGDGILTRAVNVTSSTVVSETITKDQATNAVETEYYSIPGDTTEPPRYHRFAAHPLPKRITMDTTRQMDMIYQPLSSPGAAIETHSPLLKKITYSGSDTTWGLNGAETEWSNDGAILKETQKWAGTSKSFENTYAWSGRVATITRKFNSADYGTEVHTYSADLLGLSVAVGADTTEYAYGNAASSTPWLLTEVERPGGHKTTWDVVHSSSSTFGLTDVATTTEVKEGWGTSQSAGTLSITTTNRWGGLIEQNVYSTTGNILIDKSVGSVHEVWGEASKTTGLRGEEEVTTFIKTGRNWGLATNVATPTGVPQSVSSYDIQGRPVSMNIGYSQITPSYANALTPGYTVDGKLVSAELNNFGDMISQSDARPGGGTLTLSPGTGSSTRDGRTVNLSVSPTRAVLGINSGQGTRGGSQDLQVIGGRLCLVTIQLNQSNGTLDTAYTYYDALGRVVEVKGTGANGATVSETWAYDDDARTVVYTPVAGGLDDKVKTTTRSSDGNIVTVQETGGTGIRITQSGSSGKLTTLTEQYDDSDGSAGWKQVSEQEYTPLTGVMTSVPWELPAATTTSITPPPSGNMTFTAVGGVGGSTRTVVLTDGRISSLIGKHRGVAFTLGSWTYENDRLTAVSGTIGGKSAGVEYDTQQRLSRSYGPGYDKTYTYSGAPAFTVEVKDTVQNTTQELKASATGDFTELSGDGIPEILASTTDGSGGETTTTYNGSLTVNRAAGGSVIGKNYGASYTESKARAANGALLSYGTGPEAATIAYNPTANSRTTTFSGESDEGKDTYFLGGFVKETLGPHGDKRLFTYQNGQVKTETHGGGVWNGTAVERLQDTNGRKSGVTVTGAGSASVALAHNGDGLPSGVTGPKSSAASYTYDNISGLVTSMTRGPLSTTYTYDAQNRLDTVTVTNSAGPSFSFDHNFNAKNLRTSRLASGAGVSWTGLSYDSAHRLTGATAGAQAYGYNYDSRGNRIAGGRGVETWTANGLDQATGRSLSGRSYGVSGVVNPGATLKVFHPGDLDGEILTAHPVTGVYSASWDAAGLGSGVTRVEMLVRGTVAGAGNLGSDAVADELVWVVLPALNETFSYDGAGRLSGDAEWLYEWDGRGNLIQMERRAGTHANPTVTGEVVSFQYDGEGRRVKKVHTVSYEEEADRITESKMLWEGWLPVMEERKVNGVALAKRWFVWGRDVTGDWEGAGGVGGLVAIVEEGEEGRTLLPVDDGLGNIMAVVDSATGAVVATYDHGPYGEVLGGTGELDASPFRYQSKLYDAETGHYYFGCRYYSPRMGKWLSRDPLGEAGGFNLYGYCENDPVNKWDYLGLNPWRNQAIEYLIAGEITHDGHTINKGLDYFYRSDPFFAIGYQFGGMDGASKFSQIGSFPGMAIGGVVAAPVGYAVNVNRVYKEDGLRHATGYALFAWNLGMVYEGYQGVDYFGEIIGDNRDRGGFFDVTDRFIHGATGALAFVPLAKTGTVMTKSLATKGDDLVRAAMANIKNSAWRAEFDRASLARFNVGVPFPFNLKRVTPNTADEMVTLYHGTTSNAGSKIVKGGFRQVDTFFAEEVATSRYFAGEATARTGARSTTSIEFTMPRSVAEDFGLMQRRIIGADRNLPTPDIDFGTGFERILSSGNVRKFNSLIEQGIISIRRIRH